MTKTRRFQPLRRGVGLLQALLILGIPFVRIHGESLLRFDVPSLRLYAFGATIWMDEFFVVLLAVVFLTFLLVLTTLLFGRIWCGWICPQTVLADLTGFVDRLGAKDVISRLGAYAASLLVSLAVGASLLWYFVSPYEFFPRLARNDLGPVVGWAWMILTALVFLDMVFVRRKFCATVCPYAKIQSVLSDRYTMVIAFDASRQDECRNCAACVQVCPVGIDIRKGPDSACVNCAECIDKCAEMMDYRGRSGLIGYFFGSPGGAFQVLRPGSILVGSLTVAVLLLFLFFTLTRMPYDVTVLAADDFPARVIDGRVVNAYTLALINRSARELDIGLDVADGSSKFKITPGEIAVSPGEHRKERVYVVLEGTAPAAPSVLIHFKTAPVDSQRKGITRRALFIIPAKT